MKLKIQSLAIKLLWASFLFTSSIKAFEPPSTSEKMKLIQRSIESGQIILPANQPTIQTFKNSLSLENLNEDSKPVVIRKHESLPIYYFGFQNLYLQAFTFERISSFIEATPGQISDSSENIIGSGHDLKIADIASFYNKVPAEKLTTAEAWLLSQLISWGLLKKNLNEYESNGSAVVITSIHGSRSVISHEINHAVYFLDMAYQKSVSKQWEDLPKDDKEFLIRFMKETFGANYNFDKDHDLFLRELVAYIRDMDDLIVRARAAESYLTSETKAKLIHFSQIFRNLEQNSFFYQNYEPENYRENSLTKLDDATLLNLRKITPNLKIWKNYPTSNLRFIFVDPDDKGVFLFNFASDELKKAEFKFSSTENPDLVFAKDLRVRGDDLRTQLKGSFYTTQSAFPEITKLTAYPLLTALGRLPTSFTSDLQFAANFLPSEIQNELRPDIFGSLTWVHEIFHSYQDIKFKDAQLPQGEKCSENPTWKAELTYEAKDLKTAFFHIKEKNKTAMISTLRKIIDRRDGQFKECWNWVRNQEQNEGTARYIEAETAYAAGVIDENIFDHLMTYALQKTKTGAFAYWYSSGAILCKALDILDPEKGWQDEIEQGKTPEELIQRLLQKSDTEGAKLLKSVDQIFRDLPFLNGPKCQPV